MKTETLFTKSELRNWLKNQHPNRRFKINRSKCVIANYLCDNGRSSPFVDDIGVIYTDKNNRRRTHQVPLWLSNFIELCYKTKCGSPKNGLNILDRV